MSRCFLSFLFVVVFFGNSHARAFSQMTKKATLDSIRSITTSWYRYTTLNYDEFNAYTKDVEVRGSGLTYREEYRPNGTLKCKGLVDAYAPVGTWWYNDTTGKLFKEHNFSTGKTIFHQKKGEPLQWMFDSTMRAAQRTFAEHYGAGYAESHIRISPYCSWTTGQPGNGNTGTYPEMPEASVRSIEVHASIVYDSVIVMSVSLYFDSVGIYHPMDEEYIPRKRGPFTFDFADAQRMAKEGGYDQPSLCWDWQLRDFYWLIEKCETNPDPNVDDKCSSEYICATTGKAAYREQSESTCAPTYFFTKYCNDTLLIPAGHKEVGFAGASFAAPMNWFITESYRQYNRKSFITDGRDTLFGQSDCMSWGNRAYLRSTVFDTVSMARFNSQFPDGNIQGRSYDLTIVVTGEGRYTIEFKVKEPIRAMHCSEITYLYSAHNLDAQGRDRVLAILGSMNFLYCLPGEEK